MSNATKPSRELEEEMREMAKQFCSTANSCRVCGGNDKDIPCAYTTEKPVGCLRKARLEHERKNHESAA